MQLPARDERQALALIERTASSVPGSDADARRLAAERHARLTKPPGSLGRLEQLAVRIAGITADPRPRLQHRLLVVAAADHGVAARGVSAYPQSVTAQMVSNFLAGGAAINVLADHAGARVRVVDAGVATPLEAAPGLLQLGFPAGTHDITVGPAMPRAVAARAVAAGIDLFDLERSAEGVDMLGCGEMGIANSTSAAALVAAATGRPASHVTGRGTGIDDMGYARKLQAVETALAVNRPNPGDGVGLLATVGGLEIALLSGLFLAAAAARVPAVIDGLISGAAALVAATIEPRVTDSLIASHRSAEPGHTATLEHLQLEPLLDLGLRLGEGSGAALGMSLCVAACRVLDEMATFDEAGVADSGDARPPER